MHLISDAEHADGAGINAVSFAEFCVGDPKPATVRKRMDDWRIAILDVPAAACEICAKAYNKYRGRRLEQCGDAGPAVPLPDLFIGAHAQHMGWEIATADKGRFATYFPSVKLRVPD